MFFCRFGTVVAVLTISLAAAPAQEIPKTPQKASSGKTDSKAGEESLPQGVMARVNGQDITVEDYTAYLFATLGKSRLKEYIDRLLIEDEGKRLGVTITPEEVEGQLNAEIEARVRAIYQNSMDKFTESLTRQGLSLDEYKAKRRQDIAYRILEDKCILKNRKVTDEDIQAAFKRSYGDEGIQYELRHILVSTRPMKEPGKPLMQPRSEASAKDRAEKILSELQGGAEFVQLVTEYSDDRLTRQNGGRIPYYRKGYRGKDFDEAVSRLSEENSTSPVVKTPYGYEIIKLISKKKTRLEDKREEIEKFLKTRPPTAKERNEFMKALWKKAKVEY